MLGGVEPYTVLHPVWAAIAITDCPFASRPSRACRCWWLNASCFMTVAMASAISSSLISPWASSRAVVSASSSPPRPMRKWATARLNSAYSSGLRAARAASFIGPSSSTSLATRRNRSALAWKTGRMYASVTPAIARRTLFSPQPAQAPSPDTSAS